MYLERSKVYTLKVNKNSATNKWEILKIAQDNQSLLKRLNDRQSFYDTKSWEKDYEKSQIYKKNICIFPSINFRKTKDSFYSSSSQDRYAASSGFKSARYGNTNVDFNPNPPKSRTEDFISLNSNRNQMDKQNLYKRSRYLGEILKHCEVRVYIENKKYKFKNNILDFLYVLLLIQNQRKCYLLK